MGRLKLEGRVSPEYLITSTGLEHRLEGCGIEAETIQPQYELFGYFSKVACDQRNAVLTMLGYSSDSKQMAVM